MDQIIESKGRLVDDAYRLLEELYVTMELEPGSIWSEAQLSKLVGIGRTPVREAVQKMASGHLVFIRRRHGIEILPIDVQDQLLVLETRRELERLITVRAARRASATERAKLSELASEIDAAGSSGDIKLFLRHYYSAKTFLGACARNPHAVRSLEVLWTLSRRFYFAHQKDYGDLAKVAKLHAAAARAVAAGDEQEAAAASDRLIDYADDFARKLIFGNF